MTHQPQEGKVRNCLNCSFREYWSGDYGESSGNVCNKRQYRSELEESRHGTQLQNNAYLRAPKRCCVIEPAIRHGSPEHE